MFFFDFYIYTLLHAPYCLLFRPFFVFLDVKVKMHWLKTKRNLSSLISIQKVVLFLYFWTLKLKCTGIDFKLE